MVWTKTTRAQHARDHLRYASDLTAAEWALLAPHLPAPAVQGRPRSTDLRAVVEALLYLLATGCQWRGAAARVPAARDRAALFLLLAQRPACGRASTASWWSTRRAALGRTRSPLAGDHRQPERYRPPRAAAHGALDAAKRIRGRKRHLVTDTQGFVLVGLVHEASIQDNSWRRAAAAGSAMAAGPRCAIMCSPRPKSISGPQAAAPALGRSAEPWTIEIVRAAWWGERLPAAAPALGGRAHLCLARPQAGAWPRTSRPDHRQRHGLAPHRQHQALDTAHRAKRPTFMSQTLRMRASASCGKVDPVFLPVRAQRCASQGKEHRI